jgi:hypothetical protein
MKCIKAIKATKDVEVGQIKRVDDKTAENMVGSHWQYISKSEWKLATRKPKQLEVVNDQITDSVTISEKQLKRKKSK